MTQAPGATKPTYSLNYQRDTYVYSRTFPPSFSFPDRTCTHTSAEQNAFTPIPYPSDTCPPLSTFQSASGIVTKARSTSETDLEQLKATYGANECHIPIPKFTELFADHAVAPFFVFQMFCVALWCMDEYWYYSLFTAFMLIVFECTVVFQVRLFVEDEGRGG